MNRFAIFTLVFFLSMTMGLAQGQPGWDKMSLGAAFEFSIPTNELGDFAGNGYGGSIRFQYGFDSRVVITGNIGYVSWSEKQNALFTGSASAFEILAGSKYYIERNFFFELQGGFDIMTRKTKLLNSEKSSTKTFLMVAPGLGIQLSGFEVVAKYWIFHPSYTNLAITAGYNILLN